MTPSEEINKRISNLQGRLLESRMDSALLVQAVDVFYFSGTRQNSVLWVPAEAPPVLLVRKSFRRAQEESSLQDIRPFPPSRDLAGLLAGRSGKIGLAFDVLPVQHLNFYRSILSGAEFVDISSIIRELRSVKSAFEIDKMKTSGRMLADAFKSVPEFLRPGMRELDLASEFEFRLRKSGIGGFLRIRGFNQEITGIVSSGENAALPGCFDGPVTGKGFWTAAPYGPSAGIIADNAPVVIDYGGSYDGYIVDMTRIFCVGEIDSQLKAAFDVSLKIEAWITGSLKPGNICEDIYSGAIDIAKRSGLSENFMGYPGEQSRFVGHGVGLELDELPVLAPKFKSPIKGGNTIAVEPKFLFPGKGAIGIENTYLVNESGCEKITDLPDDIVYL